MVPIDSADQIKFLTRLFLEWYDYVLNSVFFHNISSFFWECVIGKNSRLFKVCVCVYYLILCIEHDDEEIWDDYLLCAFFSFNNTRVRVVGRDDISLTNFYSFFAYREREREAFNNQFTFLSILMLAAACLHCMHILHIFSIKTLNWNAGIFHQSTAAAASNSFATIII